jgi:twitching motility protein PilT
MEDLRLPSKVFDFTKLQRGLVLVTGPTGSGKSTTLASMINEINNTAFKHIITVEDPIEFIYKDNHCIINQRAIGQDASTFSASLKSALREDPDIILVGEMRDVETVEMALHAAETGHLVLSTLHTSNAKETISRIVSMFAPAEQNRIRSVLASSLKGVISQRLVKKINGGLIPAMEVLVTSARIESLIQDGKDHQITDAIKEGKDIYQTQTFDQSLFDLVKRSIITQQTAIANASYPSDFKLKLLTLEEDKAKLQKIKEENFIGIKYDE